jgi:hypothetical protein
MSFRWSQVDYVFTGVIEDKIFEMTQSDTCDHIEYKCYYNEKADIKYAEHDIASHLNN